LFIVDQLTELGGGERVLLQLAAELAKQDIRPLVVTFRDDPDLSAFQFGIQIELLPMSSCFSLRGLSVAIALWKLIRRNHIRIVHTFFETSDTFGALVARAAGVRHIISSRRDMGILRAPRHKTAYRLLAPLYTRILAVSERVREWHLQADHLRTDQILTIHNGLSLQRFDDSIDRDYARGKFNLTRGTRVVTTIANINSWKGVDTFIAAAALVHKDHPDTEFCIAGDWTDLDLAAHLQQQARDLGIASIVHFLRRVEDVSSLLLCSDVFALLSRSEGFPNVVLEAMAARLPVVATAVGGTPEAITNTVNGLLVAPDDPAAAATLISALLSDISLSSRLAQAGRKRVESEFSLAQMTKQHIDLYRSLFALKN
jgi:glycosyltransferase involved in cell wall biosynthesis